MKQKKEKLKYVISLLDLTHHSDNDNGRLILSLMDSCIFGDFDIVELILKDGRTNPNVLNNDPIRRATEHGHTDIVKLLIKDKRVNPADDSNFLIRQAAKYGDIEIVKLLLKDKRVDPADYDNYACIWSFYNMHYEVSLLLFNQKSVRSTLEKYEPDVYNKLFIMATQLNIKEF
jgi:ankyrin repeat protein